jgi:hypothetical protein
MRRILLALMVIVGSAVALAEPPPLEPHDAGAFTVSTPRGWSVQTDSAKGLVIAQQDPTRKGAAQAMIWVVANSAATEDQVLDAITAQVATGLKVITRGPLPGGGGKKLVADGVADGTSVRIGAIVLGRDGAIALGLVVARVGEFDGLGGLGLVTSMLASISAGGATTPSPAEPGKAPAGPVVGDGPEMTPHFDDWKKLIIPPPYRTIGAADLAGVWKNDNSAISSYASAATGAYAGYDAVVGTQTWAVTPKGSFSSTYHGAMVGTGYVRAIDSASEGTITIASDGTIAIRKKGDAHITYYLLRGWFIGKDVVMMRINGPYFDAIPDDVRSPDKAVNLNSVWVRARRPS